LNYGLAAFDRLSPLDREPDNLTVIAVGTAVLECIEQGLLHVVDVTTPAIRWMNDNVYD
jgi:hypothetical protein